MRKPLEAGSFGVYVVDVPSGFAAPAGAFAAVGLGVSAGGFDADVVATGFDAVVVVAAGFAAGCDGVPPRRAGSIDARYDAVDEKMPRTELAAEVAVCGGTA